jgi:hypothetical protein
MPLITQRDLLQQVSPPLDGELTDRYLEEFISLERRFVMRDWGPAELDAGQCCELLARIFYHIDSGNLNRGKEFDQCMKYILGEQVPHAITPRHDAIHIATVLKTIYKFRSQRGAIHISPHYSANQMDARYVIESIRWCTSELLRKFWNSDREAVARAIRELLDFDVPCIGAFDDELLVQRTDVSAEDEVLLLLHYAGDGGFSRRDLGRHALVSAPSVTKALGKLASPAMRKVIKLRSGSYRLTDLGSKDVRERLAAKLSLAG